MPKVIKQMEAVFEPYAECAKEECGWNAGSSATAREQAKVHVRATGHHVRVVIEKVALWAPGPEVGVSIASSDSQ
jgi:hypothetical protein